MPDSNFIYLNQNAIIKCGGLDMAMVFDAVEEGFRIHGNGDYVMPPKTNLRKGPPGSPQADQGLIMSMPGYLGKPLDFVGIKWVLGMTENPVKHNLPRSSAMIILNDAETGLPLAVMDGTIINAVRTGAVTGVGAKYLADPESKIMSLIGAGPQGRMQIYGVLHACPKIEEIRIFDISRENAEKMKNEISSKLDIRVIASESAEEAVKDSDIIVTATVTRTPYLRRSWLKKGVFYGDIASHDAALEVYQASSKMYVDDWNQIKHHGIGVFVDGLRAGEISEEKVSGEMGEVVTGKKPGRETGDDLIIFKHIGMSVTDLPVAHAVYKKAITLGKGTKLNLWDDKPVW